MADIVARFADGRLLVQEDRAVQTSTTSGGYCDVRVGHIKTVEKVLSIDAQISGYPEQKLATELRDVLVSGDIVRVQLRRCDLGVPQMEAKSEPLASGIWSGLASGLQPLVSGYLFVGEAIGSGTAALNQLSGITSGLGFYEPLTSGRPISGVLKILANVIGIAG